MGLCLGKTSPPPPPPSWPDLPPDLVGLIICRLISHADRLSFGLVCRNWQLASHRHRTLRGITPWLNLGPGVYQSLDGDVHRFCCHGSSGSWILYYADPAETPGRGQPLFLRNPFYASAAPIEIMWPCRKPPKIAMCPSLSVAAILDRGYGIILPFASFSGPSSERHPWMPLIGDYADMAFYREKIFTVTHQGG